MQLLKFHLYLFSIERPKKKRKKREKVDGVFVPWDPSQRTMATAGRTKVNKNIEKGHFGPVPGVEVGQRWQYRIQLSELGVHAPPGEFQFRLSFLSPFCLAF